MGIDVVQGLDENGQQVYFVRHGYDLDIFTDLPAGPFASSDEAESAADRLTHALACVGD